jgi:hypothetical protein
MKPIVFILLIVSCFAKGNAQAVLPNFSTVALSDSKAQISWQNMFDSCTQISVQKSYDSLRYFQTIFSAQSPELPQNGFVDNDYLSGLKVYYRIFYVLNDGNFYFTKSQVPSKISTRKNIIIKPIINKECNFFDSCKAVNALCLDSLCIDSFQSEKEVVIEKPVIAEKKYITIFKRTKDSILRTILQDSISFFTDSIALVTKDTLVFLGDNNIILKPFVAKPIWKPSTFVYTNNSGCLEISLPNVKSSNYKLIFYDADKNELFSLKQIRDEKIIISKNNFWHAGWYFFELHEDGKLKEKNKFEIEKDF